MFLSSPCACIFFQKNPALVLNYCTCYNTLSISRWGIFVHIHYTLIHNSKGGNSPPSLLIIKPTPSANPNHGAFNWFVFSLIIGKFHRFDLVPLYSLYGVNCKPYRLRFPYSSISLRRFATLLRALQNVHKWLWALSDFTSAFFISTIHRWLFTSIALFFLPRVSRRDCALLIIVGTVLRPAFLVAFVYHFWAASSATIKGKSSRFTISTFTFNSLIVCLQLSKE